MTTLTKTITRTVSLIPCASDKNDSYQVIKERMVAFRNLENTYIDVLLTSLKNGQLDLSDFSGESKAHVKRYMYNKLKLNEIYSTHPAKITLKERMLRCAIQYPYFAVREWLVRTHYLSVIIKEFIELISSSPSHALRFLHGGIMSNSVMKRLSGVLGKNCFGKTSILSYFYITNLIGQVRNLFISSTRLEPILNARLTSVMENPMLVEEIIENALNSFTQKKKGKVEKIPNSELLEYFFKRYVTQVKRQSTWHAKHVLKQIDIAKFKQERELTYTSLINILQEYLEGLPVEFIHELAGNALLEVIEDYRMNSFISFTRHVFKPVLRAPRVEMSPTQEGFLNYFMQVVKNQLKTRLKDVFLTTPIINGLIVELKRLETSLQSIISPPRIHQLSLPINQEEGVYALDLDHLHINLSFIAREIIELYVKDEKGRIKKLTERGAVPCLPVLTMKGRKLLLHLPIELNSSDLSKQPQPSMDSKKRIEVGVDLGLKHPAVLSVMDRTNPNLPVELARYFIGVRTLLDMKFNAQSGKFELQARFSNVHSSHMSNQKQKMRNIRREARNIQRKVHEYENKFSERSHTSPKRKYKHYRLTHTLSGLWQRVNDMNREIIRQLQHVIVEIATFHQASVLKFENLKWSQHSKKTKAGSWLTFWQAHWFFSQVQEAVELQAHLRGIEFRRLRAAYTSQDCWECGTRGTRVGRSFMCSNIKHHASGKALHVYSDLNAARVIALS